MAADTEAIRPSRAERERQRSQGRQQSHNRAAWALGLVIVVLVAVTLVRVTRQPAVNTTGSTQFATPRLHLDSNPCSLKPVAGKAPTTAMLQQMLAIEQQAVYHRSRNCLYAVDQPPTVNQGGDDTGDSEAERWIEGTNFNPFGSGRFRSVIDEVGGAPAYSAYQQSFNLYVAGYAACNVQVVLYQNHWYFGNGLPEFGPGHPHGCAAG